MKKIKSALIILIASLIMVPVSCTEDYLETQPTDMLSGDVVFNSVQGAWGALNGLHRSMYIQYNSSQSNGGFAGMYLTIDMMGQDIVFNTSANGWFRGTYQWVDHRNDRATQPLWWNNLYRLISNANKIINNIDAIDGDAKEKGYVKGQALAYRAWAHFMLVQLYAERYKSGTTNSQDGVPYMKANTYEGQARNTVEEVYTAINKDITDAITLLDGYTRSNKSHINKSVAQAIQAQVALVQGNWTLAASAANAARQGYSFMTAAQHALGYNDYNNPENLWSSHVQEDQTLYFYSFYAYMSHNFNATAIRQSPKSINKELFDQITATDVRKTFFYPNAVSDKKPEVPPSGVRFNYMNSKFKAISVSDSRGDFPWIRVAEMYLIEAEALARQANKQTEAQDVLYILAKDRDPQYVKSTKTGDALIEEILVQRRIELWAEGRSWTDLKRLNRALVRPQSNNAGGGLHVASICLVTDVPAGDVRWQWFIPKDELDANPKIKQNPA